MQLNFGNKGNIVLPINNQSSYQDSKDKLGFIMTKILGDKSKPFKP